VAADAAVLGDGGVLDGGVLDDEVLDDDVVSAADGLHGLAGGDAVADEETGPPAAAGAETFVDLESSVGTFADLELNTFDAVAAYPVVGDAADDVAVEEYDAAGEGAAEVARARSLGWYCSHQVE
jgi:hypothetical protein